MLILWSALQGFVLAMYWRWFFEPIGFPAIGIQYAILVTSITAILMSFMLRLEARRPVHLLPQIAALAIGYLCHVFL